MTSEDGKRHIEITKGNYVEYLKGDYIQNIYIQVHNLTQPTGFPQNISTSNIDKFVGRQEELIRLHELLQNKDKVTLEGMGGIGKTELAILYSLTNLQCDTYPGGICWLNSREQDIGLQIVDFVRTYLGLKPPEDLELSAKVAWCWAHWKEGRTLIVLDDVKSYSDIKPYLPPQASQFKVLITTRLKLKLPNRLYLEVLTELEALELLRQLVASEKVKNEPETAKLLCQRLGYLPLAIQLVGQYVEEYDISLTEEIKRLEGKGLNDDSLSIEEDDSTWTLDVKGVKAAFELSWQELNESAQSLGCLLSLFALAPIPWKLVESAAVCKDQDELKKARVKLKRLHLLQSEDNYQLHRLLQEFFRDKQNHLDNAEEQKLNFCTAIVEIADKIPAKSTQEDLKRVEDSIPHLNKAAREMQNLLEDEKLFGIFIGLGRYYEGKSHYSEAEKQYKDCLNIVEERFRKKYPHILKIQNALAHIYLLNKDYENAEYLYRKALEQGEQWLKEKSPIDMNSKESTEVLLNVAQSKDDLGYLNLCLAQGQLNLGCRASFKDHCNKAEPLLREALKIREKLFDKKQPDTDYQDDIPRNLCHLAMFHRLQKQWSEAEKLYSEALKERESFNGKEHLLAESFHNLAVNYFDYANYCRDKEQAKEKYEEAKRLYIKSLAIGKRLHGKTHIKTAKVLNELAHTCRRLREYDNAKKHYEEALEIRKKILEEQHLDLANIDVINNLTQLARLHTIQKNFDDAMSCYSEAFDLIEKIKNNKNLNWIRSLSQDFSVGLDFLLKPLEIDYGKTTPLYNQALDLREKLIENMET